MKLNQKANILLVDDSPTSLLAMQAILEPLGESIIRATSGPEALKCLLDQDFAVILLDVHMPGMDGFEAASLIRKRDRSRLTPIIFLTAIDKNETHVAKGYSVGAVDYIFKPVDASILRSKVQIFVEMFKITEKLKEQEGAMRDFAAVLEYAVNGIARLDLSGMHMTVNNAYAGFYLMPAESMLGLNWRTVIHDDDWPRVQEAYDAMLAVGKSELELRGRRADGSHFFAEMVLVRASSENGDTDGFYCFIKDVSQRKYWEDRATLANIVESSDDAIIGQTFDGLITSWNPGAERMFGWNAGEIRGKHLSVLMPEERVGELAEVLKRLELGESVKYFETQCQRKDGSIIDVWLILSPVRDALANVVGASTIARDITEFKLLETKLIEKNKELQKAMLTKDRFLATISHELRTPLNAVIGYTGILLMGLSGELTEKQERQLKSIETSAEHLHSLINDILDLSKVASGKVRIELGTVECNAVVEEVATTLRPLADAKGLEFRLSLFPESLLLQTDQKVLKQILLNLVSNAIKFTYEGHVALSCEQLREDGKLVTKFNVVDTGIGIRVVDQNKLFQAFERIDDAIPAEGTGLGLYLSEKLSRLLGGRIEFESTHQKGSRFTLAIDCGKGG